MSLLLLLLACDGKTPPGNTFDTNDTGTPECGRVRGHNGVLMYDDADQNVVYYPTEEPDGEGPTGVAGPVGDDWTFVAVQDGDVSRSTDAGCNWEEVGSLPATGRWMLLAAGSRVYAFDPVGKAGAVSDDAGASWSPMPASVRFATLPVVADSDPNWVRGVDETGVVTSTDGGQGWSTSNPLPQSGLVDYDLSPGDLDRIALATATGVWTSQNAGLTWDDRSAAAFAPTGGKTGVVHAVAMSRTSADALAAIVERDAVFTLVYSADGGASWTRLADSEGIGLGAESDLWFAPGSADTIISNHTEPGAEFPLHLNVTAPKTGTRVVKTAIYDHMSGMAFSPGEDGRWIAGVFASGG